MNGRVKRWKPNAKKAWQMFYVHAEAEELIPKKNISSKDGPHKRRKRASFVLWSAVALLCALSIALAALFLTRSSGAGERFMSWTHRFTEVFVSKLPPVGKLVSKTPSDEKISKKPSDGKISKKPSDVKISKTPSDGKISKTPSDEELVPKSLSVEMITVQSIENNEVMVLTLPDDSLVLLAEGCRLNYPSSFANDQRRIELKGDAFFEVIEARERPFIIETEIITIEVMGASFRIRADSESLFELAVRSGVVKVSFCGEAQGLFAEEGEQVNLMDDWLQKKQIEDDDSLSLSGSKLFFKDESLELVVRLVNECVPEALQLAVGDELLSKRVINVTLNLNNMEHIAEILCNALDLELTIEEDVIYLWSK